MATITALYHFNRRVCLTGSVCLPPAACVSARMRHFPVCQAKMQLSQKKIHSTPLANRQVLEFFFLHRFAKIGYRRENCVEI
uniref:Uncharacterized protein n=1 Tax=Oryzias latipes TaxID=8090 RepID=A0A3B3H530_ORYLA